MNPYDILKTHSQLIYLILEHAYVPQKSAQNFNELLGAVSQITGRKIDGSCHGCMLDLARTAKVLLESQPKEEPLTFMTFPKQEEPKKKRPRKN